MMFEKTLKFAELTYVKEVQNAVRIWLPYISYALFEHV